MRTAATLVAKALLLWAATQWAAVAIVLGLVIAAAIALAVEHWLVMR